MKKYQNMEKKTEKKVEKKKDTKKTLFQIACEAMSWSSKAEEEGSAEVAAQNAEKVYKLFGKESIMENQSQKETEEWNTSLFEVKDKEEVEKDMEKKKRLIKEDCVTTLKMLSSFYDCLPKQVTKGEVGMTENNWDSLKTFASSLEDSLSEFSVWKISTKVTFAKEDVDPVATEYVQHLTSLKDQDKVAISSQKNGDCFYNSISLSICGDESLAEELRLRSTLNFIANYKEIEDRGREDGWHLTTLGSCRSLEAMMTTKTAVDCSAVQALSNAINCQIDLKYPIIGDDYHWLLLNQTISPMANNPVLKAEVLFAPSQRLEDMQTTHFMADHFSPLVSKDELTCKPPMQINENEMTISGRIYNNILPDKVFFNDEAVKCKAKRSITAKDKFIPGYERNSGESLEKLAKDAMAAMSEEEQAQSRMKDLGGRSKNKKKYFEGQNSEECLQKLAMAAVRKEKERETHEIMESLPQAIENDTNEEVPGPSNIVKEKIDEKKTFQCTDCQKDFANKANLKRHQSTHTKKKCFQCKSCGYATDQKANLHKHEQRRHSQDTQNTFQCSDSDCNKSFKSSSAREKHEKHHEKKFVCKICDKRFPYECRLKEHEKTHLDNEDMPHQCETCEWGFAKKDNFKKHQVTINHMRRAIEQEIRIESEEDSAEESEIVSIWNPPADIERREPMYIEVLSGNLGIFAKDKPNKRPCSESSDTSLDTPKESKSREIQKNPEDSTSERSTKTQDILTSKKEKGIQRKKNCSGTSDGNREESVVEKAKRDKQKEECVERHNFDWFTKEREKQMERQSSFPIASSSVSSQTQGGSCQTTMEPTVPKIRCPVGCKKKFSSSKELTKHLRLENDIMGKTFNCQFCEKKFTRCNDKSAHETRHREEEKPFQCRYFNCLERFSTNQERDSHYEAHFQPSNL